MLSRVLVADDDPLVCELVKEILDSVEMDTVTLTDSKEASTRLGQEKFQAVFLDVHMPRPGGIELAGQMRASGMNRSTPIVVITGEADPWVRHQCSVPPRFKPVVAPNLFYR